MISLFNQYKDTGKITEALLIGQNMLNKNPTDDRAFDAYFEFLCTLAESLSIPSERKSLTERADILLAFYSENAVLSDEIIAKIAGNKERLSAIFDTILQAEEILAHETLKKISDSNEALLQRLISIENELLKAKTQEQFDEVLTKVSKIELEINKEALSDKQTVIYDKLTKNFTESISKKMLELERNRNIEYNKQAVEAFAEAFKRFKGDESKYKSHNQLFGLVADSLFAYDASRMFNETLIYYNHVYSYIFSKLDDDGKLALTRYSVDCEKSRR